MPTIHNRLLTLTGSLAAVLALTTPAVAQAAPPYEKCSFIQPKHWPTDEWSRFIQLACKSKEYVRDSICVNHAARIRNLADAKLEVQKCCRPGQMRLPKREHEGCFPRCRFPLVLDEGRRVCKALPPQVDTRTVPATSSCTDGSTWDGTKCVPNSPITTTIDPCGPNGDLNEIGGCDCYPGFQPGELGCKPTWPKNEPDPEPEREQPGQMVYQCQPGDLHMMDGCVALQLCPGNGYFPKDEECPPVLGQDPPRPDDPPADPPEVESTLMALLLWFYRLPIWVGPVTAGSIATLSFTLWLATRPRRRRQREEKRSEILATIKICLLLIRQEMNKIGNTAAWQRTELEKRQFHASNVLGLLEGSDHKRLLKAFEEFKEEDMHQDCVVLHSRDPQSVEVWELEPKTQPANPVVPPSEAARMVPRLRAKGTGRAVVPDEPASSFSAEDVAAASVPRHPTDDFPAGSYPTASVAQPVIPPPTLPSGPAEESTGFFGSGQIRLASVAAPPDWDASKPADTTLQFGVEDPLKDMLDDDDDASKS